MAFRAAFWIGRSSLYGAAIRVIKRQGITHAELVFSDGLAVTADASMGGVVLYPFKPSAADWLMLDLPADAEAPARQFVKRELGAGYDWVGIVMAQLLPFGREHPERWFCSELCTAALRWAGVVRPDVAPCRTDPAALYRLLADRDAAGPEV